jgi:hypothetical protein
MNNPLQTRSIHDHNRVMHLEHDNGRLRAALALIVEMALDDHARDDVHDLTARIARVARNALVSAARENPALRNFGHPATEHKQ